MAQDVWIVRKMGHLVPANAQSAEALAKLPQGKWLLASIRQPRNVKHHRKFFALMQAVYPHQDMWPTFNSFRKAITAALGHGEVVTAKDGRKYIDADSISFAKMDQAEFEEFYASAVDLILTRILPGVGREDLEREVQEILAGKSEAAHSAG